MRARDHESPTLRLVSGVGLRGVFSPPSLGHRQRTRARDLDVHAQRRSAGSGSRGPDAPLAPVVRGLRPPQKEKFVPAKSLVTPPNETEYFTLKWPFGGQILKQDGATRPTTYVNPVGL